MSARYLMGTIRAKVMLFTLKKPKATTSRKLSVDGNN
jgi:hypothetical protein